ncbi:MAG: alpha/beta hydrolase [Lawsonibacter sp.]|nr:alpha/beta hydrolase [Lawsonibacter sp.]
MRQEFSFPSADGRHDIHAVRWSPEGEVRGVVQIVHGVSEHMERYSRAAEFLNGRGFLVCGGDHLGHGRTARPGEYGFFAARNGWELVVRDVRRLRELEGARCPDAPYVMLGHSMGSFLTRSYLIRWPGTLDGAVLSGTGQEPAPVVAAGKWTAGLLSALRGPGYVSPLIYRMSLGAYNRKFRPNRTPVDWLSRDGEEVDRNLADPLCRFQPTVSMFRDIMTGLQFIARREHLARMDPGTPVYLFSGDQDPVGSMGEGVRRVEGMFRRAGCRDVTVRLYPGGRHEMLNEINRQEVMEDLARWLEDRVGN